MRNPCAKPSEHIAVWKAAQGEPSRKAQRPWPVRKNRRGFLLPRQPIFYNRGCVNCRGRALRLARRLPVPASARARLPRHTVKTEHYAGVAQTAEQLPCKQRVAGSMPAVGSSFHCGMGELAVPAGLMIRRSSVRIRLPLPAFSIRWTNWLCHETFNLEVAGSSPVRISSCGGSQGWRAYPA